MNKFLLKVSDWGSDAEYEFLHPTKTKEEFKSDVNLLLKEKGEEYLASTHRTFTKRNTDEIINKWTHVDDADWIKFISPFMYDLGYLKTEPYTGIYYFDEIGIINETKKDRESFSTFQSIVGEELMNKAIEYNIRVEENG